MKKYIYLVCLTLASLSSYGQTKKEIANTKLDAAIELMDNGMTGDAVILLKEAKNMDSKTHVYDYEIAYAYYLNQEYETALKWFKKAIKYKDANNQCYQMLGNTYDLISMSEKALKTYDKGLKRFPNSGVLYLEKGVVYARQEKYDEALTFFEKGIFVEPSYAVNYHHATTLYLQSDNEIWGMIYGEIFMNLERNSGRTSNISTKLFDTYVSEIKFTSDSSSSVSFAGNHTIFIDPNDLSNPKKLQASLEKTLFKMPYRNMVYETTLSLSLVGQDTINLASLNEIRTNFINTYYENVSFGYN